MRKIYRAIRTNGVTDWHKGRTIENAPHRGSLSDEKIAEVRALREKGLTFGQISEATGVSAGYAWRICNGQAREDETHK